MIKKTIQKQFSIFPNSRGVTLVEVLVTVFLFTILMGVSLELLLTGLDSFSVNRNRTELQQELRKSIDWIKEDLRQTGSAGVTNVLANGTTYTTIIFRTATGAVAGGTITWSADTVQYLLGGTGGVQLQRISGATTKVIAQNITTLQFKRDAASPSVVTVTITASRNQVKGGTISLSYNFKVKMRN